MKRFYFLLLLSIPGMLSAQQVLQKELNSPRVDDEIIKQQVFYKDPGRSGQNVLWDFGRLEIYDGDYTLSYTEPDIVGDSIYVMGSDTLYLDALGEDIPFVGTEHYTRYYYHLSEDKLWVLGHENPTNLLQYTQPLLNAFYPIVYGDSITLPYNSEGIYSGGVPFQTEGEVSILADAEGWMILPSGDTLRHVIRIKNEQTIRQSMENGSGEITHNNSLLETYRWYSRGYRYPIFETICSFVYDEGAALVKNFETAFFYPPIDHYYLEEDEENQAILEALEQEDLSPWAGLKYNFYPNPVSDLLSVELYLPRATTVRVQVRSTMGIIYLDESKGVWQEGTGSFYLNLVSAPIGNYILDIWLDDYLISDIIMKR